MRNLRPETFHRDLSVLENEMPLSPKNQKTFLTALNAIVEDSATVAARELFSADPTANVSYPPNHGFTKQEVSALRALNHTTDLESALRKIFADAAGSAIFGALSLIDGVGDPDTKCGPWTGVVLEDQPADSDEYREMLHDEFYEAYWAWRKIRSEKKWKLDTHSGE